MAERDVLLEVAPNVVLGIAAGEGALAIEVAQIVGAVFTVDARQASPSARSAQVTRQARS